MKEQLILFETAKLAKEKGFIQKGIYPKWRVSNKTLVDLTNGDEIYYSAPTQSLLQKWLREKHNIFLWVFPQENKDIFGWEIDENYLGKWEELPDGEYDLMEYDFKSYEEALEKGLQEALKLI